MTIYTFRPTSSSQTSYAWNDPTIWVPAVVPNAPDADVIIPTVTKSDGSIFFSTIGLGSASFTTHSLSLTNNFIQFSTGTLAVGANVDLLAGSQLTISDGAVLTAAALSNTRFIDGGTGAQITVSGTLTNTGDIFGHGLTLTAPQLNNAGNLSGSVGGGLTVNVTGSPFNGTLQGGGTYIAQNTGNLPDPGVLRLNLGGLVTSNSTQIKMINGEIFSFDPVGSTYVPIESTLGTIDAPGSLTLSKTIYDWNIALTDNGLITIGQNDVGQSATLNVPQMTVNGDLQLINGILSTANLIVASGGEVGGVGTINGTIANAGVIAAQVKSAGILGGFSGLVINGPITGTGHFELGPALVGGFGHNTFTLGARLQLNGPTAQDVIFDDRFGTLRLSDPLHYTGAIKPVNGDAATPLAGDKVILDGIDVNSITSYSYSGDAHGGTLTLNQASGHIDVKFLGVFETASFTLSAGPQDLSTSPPSLMISEFSAPPLPNNPGNVGEWILKDGDGHWAASAAPGSHPAGFRVAAVSDFTGDGFADILWQNVNTGATDLWKMKHGGWAGSVEFGTHPGSGWQIGGAGDFNGDGTNDVFWFNPGTGETDIWQLANGQWAGSVSPGSHPAGYQVAGIADFNHDGTSDVLWFNPATRNVDEWNIVNGHWAGSNSIGNYPNAGFQIAGVGDFNGDGTGDVLWYNPSTGVTDIWLLQNGHWSASVSPGSHPSAPQVAGIGDFNGDGTSDVLWYNPNTRLVEEWLINDGHWAASITVGTHPDAAARIAGVGDFNGGGTSDVLWHQFV